MESRRDPDRPAPRRAAAPALLALATLALVAPAPRDLDVGVPPGSPLRWSAAFPAYTPPRAPLLPVTGESEEEADPTRSRGKLATSDADVRFANAYGQVRILTWDLAQHLEWMRTTVEPAVTGRSSLRPRPPEYGEPLYWLSLAPLLRLLLHPDSLARPELMAHVLEIGEAALPVLAAASAERDLAPTCRELRALLRVDLAPLPSPPAGDDPRANALARVVLEELLRDEPLDPSDDFGRRLFLFAEEAEPLIRAYARHPSLSLSRNAAAALGRYETRTAVEALAALAASTDDPVTLVRALAGLGRFRGALDVEPLLARLRRTEEPVQRAALIGALGAMGRREAVPLLLELGEEARESGDADLMVTILAALADVGWPRAQPELAAFCARVEDEAGRIGKRQRGTVKPDVPDPPDLRATILRQLGLLARSQALPGDEETAEELLALAEPGPVDDRVRENAGAIDPLASIPQRVRFLYVDGLLRAGERGVERLSGLVGAAGLETALRGRALALLPYDQRGERALALLDDPATPVELRIQALEILIGDVHPRVEEVCRARIAAPALQQPRPEPGELYLGLRALRFLSEAGKLKAHDLQPLYHLVRLPVSAREAALARLRELLKALAEDALAGARPPELEEGARAVFDFTLESGLNPALEADMRDTRVGELVRAMRTLRSARAKPEEVEPVVGSMAAQLLGGDFQNPWLSDAARRLFRPNVPLAEEVLLALGRTRDPLATELLLATLRTGERSLRAHACLALGMCGQKAVADRLLPALLDTEPFVRFCAAESLRHLTGRAVQVDWMSASSEERRAAAEAWRAALLGEDR